MRFPDRGDVRHVVQVIAILAVFYAISPVLCAGFCAMISFIAWEHLYPEVAPEDDSE